MDIITLALAKKYANKVAAGFSSVSVEDNKIIFTLNDGKTAEMTVPAPANGKDGISITNVEIDDENNLLCTLSNGETINAGKLPIGSSDNGSLEQVQSDWSQNDETQPSYIKNRPFYESTTATNIINPTKTVTLEVIFEGDAINSTAYNYTTEELERINTLSDGEGTIKLTINGKVIETPVTISNKQFSVNDLMINDMFDDLIMISINQSRINFGHMLEIGNHNFDVSLSIVAPGEVVKIDEKYLPDTVVFEDEVAQSDWNQNDSTQPDYIKNRPFYEDVTTNEIVILEKGDRDFPLTNDEMMFYTYTFTEEEKNIMNSLTSGTLKLTVNSEYSQEKYIADIQQSVVANGPESFNVTLGDGNTVRFRLKGDSLYIALADETRYNVELVCITETSSIVKIDEKFLPDTIATKEYVDQAIGTALEGSY